MSGRGSASARGNEPAADERTVSTAGLRLGTGHAHAYGAITVVNAIATGRGAAIGIDLVTQATVHLAGSLDPDGQGPSSDAMHPICAIQVTIADEPEEDTRLAALCVRHVCRRVGLDTPVDVRVETRSTIPISRGLKSSSAAANAIVLATCDALGVQVGDGPGASLSHQEAISLGIDAALEAGVTITGAYDDAAASYHGGLVVTDNPNRAIVHEEAIADLDVLLVVPRAKVRTFDTATSPTHPLRPIVDEAWALAKEGRWQEAMLRNSLAYGGAYGLSNRLTLAMLDTGALAAGISGTGPAVAVLVRRDDWDCFTGIIETLAPEADVYVAHTRRPRASTTPEATELVAPLKVQEAAA